MLLRGALKGSAWMLGAMVLTLTLFGEDVRGFFVGAAGWKDWTVDYPLSLLFFVSLAVVAVAVGLLGWAWIAMYRRPADDDQRRRLIMASFALAIAGPMLLINGRSLGRLVVYDHPRKDLGWKEELIDVASWLSENRMPVVAIGAVVVGAALGRYALRMAS